MTTEIRGTGSCVPREVVTNEDLTKWVDTSDEWIISRTGIHKRRLAKEETLTYMGAEAAKSALRNAGANAEEVELIITATMSADEMMPGAACQIQKAIGAKYAAAFDLNAACSGFLFALNTAHAYISSGIYKNALVIGGEVLSKLVNWEDRSTCVLFGDGAGAAFVKASSHGMIGMVQGSDGAKGGVLACPSKEIKNPLVSNASSLSYIQMDGQEVFRFAVTTVPKCIKQLLLQNDTRIEEIKYFVLHQANMRIIQSVAKRLGLSEDKFPMNLEQYGNTSAASIPILLDEMNQKKMLHKGDKIILSGFGGGLTWAASLLEW